MEDGATKNEELDAFRNRFGLLDRFFVADVIRDCLLSHETFVNDTGLQLGSPKSVAEELLSVHHLFSGENPSQGMAYAIVETVFGLVVQSRDQCALRHTYLSRVLLEVTRLRPQLISPALAVAMTNAFEDYMPALVPTARDNISRWFAFHLTNTDYQWPTAYWKLWEPYALSKKVSSRGCFVRRAIQVMLENVADPTVVINGCLSTAKSLAEDCFPGTKVTIVEYAEGDLLGQFETEIEKRVWDQDINPNALQEYILGNEVNSSLVGADGRWLKTIALVRVLVAPLKKIQKSLKDVVSKNEEDGMDQMVDDTHESKDYYILVVEAIEKYRTSLIGILNKEAELYGDVTEGGALALRQVQAVADFNSGMLQNLITSFLKYSVVEGAAIIRWALGDLGETVTAEVVSRWWEFASEALQKPTGSIGGDGGMIVDGTEAEATAIAARQSILTYAVRRVCSLLSTKNEKRLDPKQADLLEGMKVVAFRAKCLDGSSGKTSPLADLCSGCGGSMAVELLKSSLMQL